MVCNLEYELIKSYSKVEECDATMLNRNAKAGNKKKKI